MREELRGAALWLGTGFRAAPVVMAWGFVGNSLTGLLPPAQTYAIKLVIDGLTDHQRGPLLIAAGILIGSVAYRFLYRASMGSPIGATTGDRIHGYVHADLIAITTGIPGIEHYERPDVVDRIELLHRQAWNMSFNVLNVLSVSISTIAGIAAIVALLVTVQPLFLLLPVAGSLRVWAGSVESRIRFAAREQTARYSRQADRLTDIATSPRHGLEMRVFDSGAMILNKIDTLWRSVEAIRIRAARSGCKYQIGARLLFCAAYVGAIGLITSRALTGRATPGDIALIVLLGSRIEQTATQLAGTTTAASETIHMFSAYAWLRRYARTATATGQARPAPARLRTGITLNAVTFCYPGTQQPVLDNIDLHLPAGTTIALVGENGAGKTTLVTLLTRLYEPTSGTVLIDDQNLGDLDPDAWRHRLSAGFQDFTRFEFTAGQTVGIGDLPRIDEQQAIRHALYRGDATDVIDHLPDGPHTQLGTRFSNGIDLSGGQWQRFALARTFMRTEPLLLILDEPTAALDPESEHDLFERLTEESRQTTQRTGSITILVSHRFSTVRAADLIIVMHHGHITETGTHEQLIAAHGRYSELYNIQARHYR